MNALKNDPLGMRAIDTVKQSDAKEWAIRMSEKGYAYKTIDNYKRSLKASFTWRYKTTVSERTHLNLS